MDALMKKDQQVAAQDARTDRRPRIAVVGSLNADIVLQTSRMPKAGESVIANWFKSFPGGKGANQAVAAARLGGDVSMYGMVGADHFGGMLLGGLRAEGIDTTGVLQAGDDTGTGVAFVMLENDGQNRILSVPGANGAYGIREFQASEDSLGRAELMLLQLEIPMPVIEYAIEFACGRGIPVVLNPGPTAPLRDELLRKVSVLTPNETEAEYLTGLPVRSVAEAGQAARKLLARGAGAVIVTLGGGGALWAEGERMEHIPAKPVTVVDTVAAGDTFTGALAVRLAQGAAMADAVAYANAAASLAVTKTGAMVSIPTGAEVAAWIRQSDGDDLPGKA